MKILVVFYSLHVCPWIPDERNKFPILVFLGNIFFQIFQETFEIHDGRQGSHDHPIENTFQKFFFSHSYISWSCYGSEKVS
jgi:hypothetical protein